MILTSFMVSRVLWSELVWNLQDSQEIGAIVVYPGLCMSCTTLLCFRGYPQKIKLIHDPFYGSVCTPMLQLQGPKCMVSLWCLFFAGLGCASMSNLGSKPSWFSPTITLSLQGNIAIVTLFLLVSGLNHEGCWLSWLTVPQSGHVRPIHDPFNRLVHFFWVPTSFSLLDSSDDCWKCMSNCSEVPHDCVGTAAKCSRAIRAVAWSLLQLSYMH